MSTNDTAEKQAAQNADAYRPRWAPTQPIPGVGQLVVYHPRPGEGRSGRICFPAMVLQADEGNGYCMLMVFFDAADIREATLVPPRSEQNPRGWEWPAAHQVASNSDAAVLALAKRVFGDGNPYEGSLIDLIKDLYDKVAKLRADLTPKAKPAPAVKATSKPPKRK